MVKECLVKINNEAITVVRYGDTDIQYNGRYQGQIEPTASRSNLDKKVYV